MIKLGCKNCAEHDMAKDRFRRLRRCMVRAAAIVGTSIHLDPAGAAPSAPTSAAIPDAALCAQAISAAATRTGVPADLLHAIARVESGRRGAPWPWALNVEGKGTWYDSREDLEAQIRRLQAAGKTSFDIGCFQINTRWHAAGFETLATMADPLANAHYAADFLSRLFTEFGSWEAATGAFHSRTPALAEAYLARVASQRTLTNTEGAPAPAVALAPPAHAAVRSATAYPLLHGAGGGKSAPGSIVPTLAARAPFLRGWAAP